MSKKQKLQALYAKVEALQNKGTLPVQDITEVTNSLIDEEVAQMAAQIKDNPKIKILQRFSEELKKFKNDFDIKPILSAVKELKQEIEQNNQALSAEFERKLKAIKPDDFDPSEIIKGIKVVKDTFVKDFETQNSVNAKSFEAIYLSVGSLQQEIEDLKTTGKTKDTQYLARLDGFRTTLNKLSQLGGGSINRQIFIGGVDALSRYSDINFKAGSNVTLTFANNNTTKKTDVTITATGGGGGAGITRSINSVSVNTAAGNSSAVDYVYLCSGTMTLTLPDASANTNLYTIKNVGTGVITVNTTSAQTIDGSLTAVLPLQYTSIDVESDSVNWNLT